MVATALIAAAKDTLAIGIHAREHGDSTIADPNRARKLRKERTEIA
jgi:hypothetical protein